MIELRWLDRERKVPFGENGVEYLTTERVLQYRGYEFVRPVEDGEIVRRLTEWQDVPIVREEER